MRPPSGAPRIRDYLTILRDGWVVILCATLVSAGVGFFQWRIASPVYVSTAKLFVVTPGSATTLDAYYGELTAEPRAATFQQLARSSQVTSRTIEQLGLPETAEELAAHIIVPPTNSALFDVVVTGTDAQRTQEVASSVAANMISLSREMASVDTVHTELVLVDDASPAQRQGSMWKNILTATLLGFALSIVLISARGLLEDRLLGRGQVDRVVGEATAERNR
ncbi:YveK family protein [Mycobacterium sp.]|uniref:YveK family protein n=1 Tax=Mycobacterium sp. TaxID=1785 RepID=UPI002BEF850D|nr:Wzz/FepE/Etk N-terminal domain-containing protein [Mycobacterium sp.]HKP40997.1 Wzz/FepE/Etk N-terminal domain-containing protein [Mycobacterium sp.]